MKAKPSTDHPNICPNKDKMRYKGSLQSELWIKLLGYT
jgi:hypothetical protein